MIKYIHDLFGYHILLGRTDYPYVGFNSNLFKYIFPILMATYMLYMLTFHQSNISLILYARDIEDSVEYFIMLLIIQQLYHISYKSLHMTA